MSDPLNLPEAYETVSAAELRRNFGVWQERAFTSPVVVARHGKPRLVLSSARHYLAATNVGEAQEIDLVRDAIVAIPEHSGEALLVMDRELIILAVNRVFEDLVGRHASRLIGHAWADVFPQAGDDAIGAQFRHVLRTGAAVQFDAPSALIEGRHYAFTAFPHEHGVAALIVNRTTEVAMREELEERRSLAAAFALLSDAAYVRVSLRAFIRSGSVQVRNLLGFDPTARPQVAFADILTPDCRASVMERLDAVLAGGEPGRIAARLAVRGGGALPVRLSMAPVWRGPASDGAVAFFRVDRA